MRTECFPALTSPTSKGMPTACFVFSQLRTFSLTAIAPASWKVLSNNPLEKKEEGANAVTHIFSTTPKIRFVLVFDRSQVSSTYLYALVAGPYDQFDDNFDNDRIPLGIYCRKYSRVLPPF